MPPTHMLKKVKKLGKICVFVNKLVLSLSDRKKYVFHPEHLECDSLI